MRCDGDRCSALSGRIGVATSCTIYAVRPEVCRTCMPGDAECDDGAATAWATGVDVTDGFAGYVAGLYCAPILGK